VAARRRAGRGARVMLMGAAARVSTQRAQWTVGRPSTGPRAARRVAEALRLRCGARAHLPVLSIQPLSTAYSHLHTDSE
jgi:hypothetical protein